MVSEAQISMLFGLRKPVTLKNNGQISTEMVGVEFHYMISPAYYDIIKNHHGKQVVMTYDLNDLSVAYLWKKADDSILLSSLCEVQLFELPIAKGPNKNLSAIEKAKERARIISELRDQDLESMIGEDSQMMATYTNKRISNAFEDDYLNGYDIPLKKASGDDYSPEDIEDIILRNTSQNY